MIGERSEAPPGRGRCRGRLRHRQVVAAPPPPPKEAPFTMEIISGSSKSEKKFNASQEGK